MRVTLVATFNDVRQRVLRKVVHRAYARARASYEAKNDADAATGIPEAERGGRTG
jgi:hypothetical protein